LITGAISALIDKEGGFIIKIFVIPEKTFGDFKLISQISKTHQTHVINLLSARFMKT